MNISRLLCLAVSALGFFTSCLHAQVRITEVNLSTRKVELTNFGSANQSLSGWFFCHRFSYLALSGSLAEGETKEFSVTFNLTSSDLGLYNSSTFSSPAAMQDFVQWGAGGIGREGVAASKGIWTAGVFLNVPASGLSFHSKGLLASGVRDANWFTGRAHAGFPVPDPVIESAIVEGGQWTVTCSSFYLPAALKPETNTVLSGTWSTVTPAATDLGDGKVRLVYAAGSGSQEFTRIRAVP
ncbi:MAG: hypothetical protein ACKV19_08225 [Verrucomicrobiales bacterium]